MGEGGPRSGADEGGGPVHRATTRHARALRRASTFNERKLWRLLRDRRLDGFKFRRQVPIGRYVVDFMCLSHRLIVEADGPFHEPEADAVRDAWLGEQGFRVVRFANHEIDARDWEVVRRVLCELRACAPSSVRLRRPPSPAGREGA